MGGEPVEAARWHARAGRWASPRDARASIRHWRSARNLLAGTEEPKKVLQLRAEACREILFTSWRTGAEEAEWRAVYEEGTDLARRLDDKRTLSMLVSGVGGLRGFAGEHRVQVEMLEEALRLAREAGDFALEASMYQRLGWAWGLAGDNNRQLEWTQRGIAFCEQDVSRAGRVSGFDTYAWLLGQRGISLMGMARLDEARAQLERALEVSLHVGDQFCVNYARGNLGQLAFCCGDAQAIRRHAIRDESGGPAQQAYSLANVGLASLHLEEWEAACELLEAAYLAFDAVGGTGVKMWHAAICSSLAQAALKVGKGDRACELAQELRQAFREAPELQSSYPHILLAWVQVLLFMDGRRAIAEVEPVLEQILTAARERGWALYLPFALHERANLARLLGNEAARERDLREAHRLFTEMGLTVRAEEVEKEMGHERSDE
jgi:tetratricopeptide (TPR) repeat protein